MKRLVMCGMVLGTTLAIGVGAQEPTPRPPAAGQPTTYPPAAASMDQRAGQKVTVTGCLQSASMLPGAPPSAEPAPGAAGYILTKASSDTASSTAKPGAPGEPAAAGTTGIAGKTYRLVGGESQDLKQFVGQRVEVTGTVSNVSMKPESPGAAPEPGAAASGRDKAPAQSLTVTTIKAAAGGSCSQ